MTILDWLSYLPSKRDPELIKAVKAEVRQFENKKLIDKLYKKWKR